jgi:predicted nucleic acid-binding protein
MATEPVCVDAGIVVRRVAFPDDVNIQRVWDEWELNSAHLVAPSLLYYEVTNVLHRYQHRGWLSAPTVQSVLVAALALPVDLFSDAELHLRARETAAHYGLPAAYDAHYLALAERLGAKMYTTDRRLVNALGSVAPAWLYHLAA